MPYIERMNSQNGRNKAEMELQIELRISVDIEEQILKLP
jgi:hypothetical protein